MKAIGTAVLTMSCVALIGGAGFAAPSCRAAVHRQAHPQSGVRVTTAGGQKLQNSRGPSGKQRDSHVRLGPSQFVDAKNDGSARIKTASNTLAFLQSVAARPVGQSLNNTRHRGANPAAVGGSALASRKNPGNIDGSKMQRRP